MIFNFKKKFELNNVVIYRGIIKINLEMLRFDYLIVNLLEITKVMN